MHAALMSGKAPEHGWPFSWTQPGGIGERGYLATDPVDPGFATSLRNEISAMCRPFASHLVSVPRVEAPLQLR